MAVLSTLSKKFIENYEVREMFITSPELRDLMVASEKIEDLGFEISVINKKCTIEDKRGHRIQMIVIDGESPLDSLTEAVNEFCILDSSLHFTNKV